MPSTTISPHARIGALIEVLLTALTGTAIYLMNGHSQPATVTPPATQTTPSKPVHVVRPTVNPLLPSPVRRALMRYPLAVVAFSNPHSAVDRLTIAEARAGAAAAHVPFVSVNLLDDSVAGPLTALLPAGELLPNPGFAIYKRAGTLEYRSDGYLSSANVAQAVKEAR